MRKWLLSSLLASIAAGQAWAQTQPIFISQGPGWTASARIDFYTRDQGSKVIPLAWMQALKQPNGEPFLADSLARYGYLPQPGEPRPPAGRLHGLRDCPASQTLGMNCSACHTRQITVQGQPYRIDGGPAFADFQSFLTDLDTAVGKVAERSDAAFDAFAKAVLRSSTPDADDVADLKQEVKAWYERYHTLMSRALPKPPAQPWGPARLDAVGMIFNRLTGLDLGPPPSLLIPENIKVADAPARYPFLWNAAIQDKTQWPGLRRRTATMSSRSPATSGRCSACSGVFEPKRDGLLFNFLNNNSANWDGLDKLEDLVKRIPPPKWPWSCRRDARRQGQGHLQPLGPLRTRGCNDCHGIKPGKRAVCFNPNTWETPIQNVGTDTRE